VNNLRELNIVLELIIYPPVLIDEIDKAISVQYK